MFRRRWRSVAIGLGLLGLLAAAQASAEIYRWVDASGREHFATDLNQVPPAYRHDAADRAKASKQRINVVKPQGGSTVPAKREPAGARQKPRVPDEKPGGYGEAWWRRKYATHVKFVESAKDFIEYQKQAAGRSYSRDERRAVGFADKNLRAAEKRLADFLAEARRAGVPPGWVR